MTKVLLISDRSLFAQGLEDLLRVGDGIEFVGRRSHSETLAGHVEESETDVVLLDCTDPGNCLACGLLRCLCDSSVRGIVCVSLADNSIFVLRGERRMLQDVQDLMAVVAGKAPRLSQEELPSEAGPAGRGKEAEIQTVFVPTDQSHDLQIGGFNG